jgi:hypothetical protein
MTKFLASVWQKIARQAVIVPYFLVDRLMYLTNPFLKA